VCVCVWSVCVYVDQLDKLLDCQKPSSTAADTHDEHLLIVTHQGHSLPAHSQVVKDSRRKAASQRAPCTGQTHTHRPRNVGNNRPHFVRRKIYPDGRLIALKGGKLKVGNPNPEIG